ncbi:hypothetical protein TEA_005606 [Camellia sinensis var. sinensis]|uniref:Glycosyl transferase CAP10 domain-containing protein n=1 Tax=Camellia sinensis var. sinensis TaxID=542762 RepID=A0A4S4EHV4_CAMSN|nr:hypothetical protein TEA_005606 [Camellia sinensis var. sinensis]
MGDRICSLFLRKLIEQPMKTGAPVRVSLIFFLVLLIGAFVCLHWIDVVPSPNTGISLQKMFLPSITSITSPIGINCSITCPENSPVTVKDDESLSSKACPEYFQWIQQDLNPWKEKGITKQMVESVESKAHMRIVVVNGRVYVKKLRWVYQTRDVYTVWGILQLLRLYPGKLPDLDFMFECGDKPVILKSDYGGSKAKKVPPMLHYCGSNSTLDIVFPDWSFWGWPELKIKPWKTFKKDLEEGNQRVKWIDRIPYAYWKGNSRVSSVRKGLHKCNVTHKQDWGALIYELLRLETEEEEQGRSSADGRKEEKPSKTFTMRGRNTSQEGEIGKKELPRYKIYVEGAAWSAQEIGKAGSKFVQEELNMKNVYDYMFHLLYEYGKLLKYKPTVPDGSIEVCSETMACSGKGLRKKFKINSMVKGPADTSPCTMPPPYDPTTLQSFLQRKENLTKQVERWRKSARTPTCYGGSGVDDNEAGRVAKDIVADIAIEEIYLPKPEPALPPLRVRPFDLSTYHSCIHAMAPGSMLWFEDFARGAPKAFLLSEHASHLFHNASELRFSQKGEQGRGLLESLGGDVAAMGAMPAGMKDKYAKSWDTSQMRNLLEGPFCLTWYLIERFVCQTIGLPTSVVPAPPPTSMTIANSLPVEVIVQFMAGQDARLFHGVGDYTEFIKTHIMPPLTGACAGDATDMAEPYVGGVAPTVHVVGACGVRKRPPSVRRLLGPGASTCTYSTGGTSSSYRKERDDAETSGTEETMSAHSRFESGEDDDGSGSKSGEDDAGSESHSSDDSDTDSDSAPESPPRKRTKRASQRT